MRKWINVLEAQTLTEDVNVEALNTRLIALANRFVSHPFDISWDYAYGKHIKSVVAKTEKMHGEGVASDLELDPTATTSALDMRDVWLDLLPDVWRSLVANTFSMVSHEAKEAELEYQQRQGERLDHEAGYEHDMHYIEDSDWLRALTKQRETAVAIAHSPVGTMANVAALVTEFENLATDWVEARQTDQSEEPILLMGLHDGIAGAIPLLCLVVGKLASLPSTGE